MRLFNRHIFKAAATLPGIAAVIWWLLGFPNGTLPGRYHPETNTFDVWWDKTGFACEKGYFRIKFYTPWKKHGLCDTAGHVIVPFRYDYVDDMRTNSLVLVGNKGKYGVVNSQGEVVVPVEYPYIKIQKDYIRASADSAGGMAGMKSRAFDLSGKPIFPEEWVDYLIGSHAYPPAKDDFLVAVKDTLSYFYFFATERLLKKNIRLTAYHPLDEKARTAYVTIAGPPSGSGPTRYGLMDLLGKDLLLNQYDCIKILTNDVFLVQQGNLFGIYDAKSSEWMLPVRYFGGHTSVGLAGHLVGIKRGNRFRYMDRQGRVILSERNTVLNFNDSVLNFLHSNGQSYHLLYNEDKARYYWYRGTKAIN